MTSHEPAIEFLQDREFWALVDLARSDWQQFAARLRELPTPVVAGFVHMFYGLESTLMERSRELLCSEDAADDFCGWVVGLGEVFFVRALAEPECLDEAVVAAFEQESGEWSDSAIRHAGEAVYRERTGQELAAYAEPLYDPWDSEVYGPLIRARG